MEDVLTWAYNVLETTPTRWTELTAKLPAELLTRPPAAGEWSAVDCLQHLVDTERGVFPARVCSSVAPAVTPIAPALSLTQHQTTTTTASDAPKYLPETGYQSTQPNLISIFALVMGITAMYVLLKKSRQ